MSEQTTKRRGPITLVQTSRRFRRAMAAVVAALLLYMLSIGPACFLVEHDVLSRCTTSRFYWPMLFVGCRGFKDMQGLQVLQWYVDLFVDHPGFNIWQMASYANACKSPPANNFQGW